VHSLGGEGCLEMKTNITQIIKTHKKLLAITVSILLLSVILIVFVYPKLDREVGNLIFARIYTSGMTRYRYDEIVAIFDTGNIYQFTIEESHGIHLFTDNDISSGRISSILHKIKDNMNFSLWTYEEKGYFIESGYKGKISDTELIVITSYADNIDFLNMDDNYYNDSAPTDGGTTILFANIHGINKTVSDYCDDAPASYQILEAQLNQLAIDKCS
jgi:hypothetical protein